jgi:simple sugar transport system permease protein
VLNLGVEGMMLCGAVAGFAVAFSTGSTGSASSRRCWPASQLR